MATDAESDLRSRGQLSRERIFQAALELADEAGIEALSMRRLAGVLGVEAMSLYHHVANKGELVDGIVDLVVGEIALPDGPGDWDGAVRRCAVSAHEAFLRHPWACSLVVSGTSDGRPRAVRLRYMDWLLGRLTQAGFAPALTYRAYHALDSHILGFTFWELGHLAAARDLAGSDSFANLAARLVEELRPEYPDLATHAEQHMSPPSGRDFEFGLNLIIDGLKRTHAQS